MAGIDEVAMEVGKCSNSRHTGKYYFGVYKIGLETWMDLEITILSEVSQTEKDKCMILLICGI